MTQDSLWMQNFQRPISSVSLKQPLNCFTQYELHSWSISSTWNAWYDDNVRSIIQNISNLESCFIFTSFVSRSVIFLSDIWTINSTINFQIKPKKTQQCIQIHATFASLLQHCKVRNMKVRYNVSSWKVKILGTSGQPQIRI